jgi:hypothetical protein
MSWIEWPSGCDPEKYLPTTGRFNLQSDSRHVTHVRQFVGISTNDTRAILGLIRGSCWDRTWEEVDKILREHLEQTGMRATCRSHRTLDEWLRVRGSSIVKRYRELGLFNHLTLEVVDQRIKQAFAETGRRPTRDTLGKEETWLTRHCNSSLAQRCDELGIPKLRMEHSLASVDATLTESYQVSHKRPTKYDHPNEDDWLRRNQNSSVSKRCTELGLGGPLRRTFTYPKVDAALVAHYDLTGMRPTIRTHCHEAWWLQRQGSGLTQRCDELGFPKERVYQRTISELDSKWIQHYRDTGRRPTCKGYHNDDAWLRAKGTSIAQRCDVLEIPWTK